MLFKVMEEDLRIARKGKEDTLFGNVLKDARREPECGSRVNVAQIEQCILDYMTKVFKNGSNDVLVKHLAERHKIYSPKEPLTPGYPYGLTK